MKLALSKQGSLIVERLSKILPNAVLLTGEEGIGLQTIARTLGASHGTTRVISPQLRTKASTVPQISIDTIRELYTDTRTQATEHRIIILDDADAMSLPAQNSFLKLLEEPTSSTHFILTSHRPERLLPTVRSRLQAYHFPVLSSAESKEFLATLPPQSTEKQTQLQFIADGLPAELTRLVGDDQYFESAKARMQLVRKLLDAKKYHRAVAIMKAPLDRKNALQLIETTIRTLIRQPDKHTATLISALLRCHQDIQNGGNIKLHLMNAVV